MIDQFACKTKKRTVPTPLTKIPTKKPKKKKFQRVDKGKEDKELNVDKNTSRVLEVLENQKEKILETQSQTIKEEPTFNNVIKVGVMLPLSGEHSEIGNLILNAIEMAVFQTDENKLELHIKDTEAKSNKAKKVFEIKFFGNNESGDDSYLSYYNDSSY